MGSIENELANTEIYVGDESGGELKRLTENDIYDGYPAWSPDGKRIVFMRGVRGSNRFRVLDLKSKEEWQVPESGFQIHCWADWMPDGKHLLVVAKTDLNRNDNEKSGLAELDMTKGAVRWLYKGEGSILTPCFSPNGKNLAYIVQSRRPSFNWSYELEFISRVNVLDLDTERIKPVDDGPEGFERDLWPIWSPDSKRLAWLRDDIKNQISKIVVHDPETKKSLKITLPERIADVYSLVWSPDGKHLACVTQDQARKHTLRVVTLNSGKYRNVVATASQIQCLYWR
jgi:TolB protein